LIEFIRNIYLIRMAYANHWNDIFYENKNDFIKFIRGNYFFFHRKYLFTSRDLHDASDYLQIIIKNPMQRIQSH
jgi:hypothetical protein